MGMSSSAALAARLATLASGTLVSNAAGSHAPSEYRLCREHGTAEGGFHIYLKCTRQHLEIKHFVGCENSLYV